MDNVGETNFDEQIAVIACAWKGLLASVVNTVGVYWSAQLVQYPTGGLR
jgi:hypothetical protein